MTYPAESHGGANLNTAKIIYALMAVGYFIPVTALAGVVFAYISRGQGEALDTHLRFQIRTFWISILIAVAAVVTLVIGIGFLLWAFLAVWGLIRVVSGYLLADAGQPVSGSRTLGMRAI